MPIHTLPRRTTLNRLENTDKSAPLSNCSSSKNRPMFNCGRPIAKWTPESFRVTMWTVATFQIAATPGAVSCLQPRDHKSSSASTVLGFYNWKLLLQHRQDLPHPAVNLLHLLLQPFRAARRRLERDGGR